MAGRGAFMISPFPAGDAHVVFDALPVKVTPLSGATGGGSGAAFASGFSLGGAGRGTTLDGTGGDGAGGGGSSRTGAGGGTSKSTTDAGGERCSRDGIRSPSDSHPKTCANPLAKMATAESHSRAGAIAVSAFRGWHRPAAR